MKSRIIQIAGFAVLCLVATVAACAPSADLLGNVKVSPTHISPNGDARDDVAVISYRIGQAESRLSVTLIDSAGVVHPFRLREPRSAGEYQAKFSGVVQSALALTPFYTATQAGVLPDGVYRVLVEAEGKNGQKASSETPLTIEGGDASPPGFADFSIFTPSFDERLRADRGEKILFTPNRDGVGDRVAVSYWLSKEATVEVYLIRTDDAKATKYPISPVAKLKPGRHNHDYEGGVDLGNTPPPDGDYLVVGEAIDAIGNHAVTSRPLTIADGGVPLAQIISASISPTSVPVGGLLRIDVVVENVGTVAIRSQGPYSGTVYTTEENYNTKGFYDNPGVFRVGADFEGNSGAAYPFRWGFHGDKLAPGERQTVTGYVKIAGRTSKQSIYFWVGLQHEQVRVINDKANPKLIAVGF